jgi:acid phosphatase family membrane protein YuiD
MAALLENRILIAAFLAWAIAQVSKTLYELIRFHELKLSRLVSSGGMPSSHSALVTGLATATGRVVGPGSAAFAISVVLARIINQMIDEAWKGHPIGEERLRELIGHTPIQVFVGGLLGIAVGLLITL